MDWTIIKPGLLAWVADFAGLRSAAPDSRPHVYWRDKPQGYYPPAYALLHVFGTTTKGTDGVRYEFVPEAGPVPEHLEPSTFGNRLFTLQIDFRALNQADDKRADVYAERLRNRLVWPRSHAALKALNLAIVRAEPTVDLSGLVDQRQESRCVMDFRFATVIRERDASAEGRTGYFERAELETTYELGEDELVVGPEAYGLPEDE